VVQLCLAELHLVQVCDATEAQLLFKS